MVMVMVEPQTDLLEVEEQLTVVADWQEEIDTVQEQGQGQEQEQEHGVFESKAPMVEEQHIVVGD